MNFLTYLKEEEELQCELLELLSFIFYIYPRVLSSWLILFICWLIHVVGINCIIILGCKKFSMYRHLLNMLLLPAHPKKKKKKEENYAELHVS